MYSCIGVFRNFTKFTGKRLCHSLFFNKVAGLRPATLLKKKLWHGCFSVNFLKFLRTSFFLLATSVIGSKTTLCHMEAVLDFLTLIFERKNFGK